MKNVLVGILVLLLFVGCSDNPTEPDPPKVVRQLTAAEQALVASGNTFGISLFKEIAAQEPVDSNLFISPLSVSMSLGMVYNGARDETQAAMAEVLALSGMDLQEVNESYQSLIELLRGLDDKVDFNLANSIWYRQGFTVEQQFVDLNANYFDAEVSALDFTDPAAPGRINSWVDKNTNGKIKEIVKEIPPQMVMYLINAIYFKADWSEKFDKDDTRPGIFTRPDGSQVDCLMMSHMAGYRYFHGDGLTLVELPYGDSLYSMVVLLPDADLPLAELTSKLDQAAIDGWLEQSFSREVLLSMPKYELEYKLKLNDVLKAQGMEVAFDPDAADLSGINQDGGLYLDVVMHKTYVKVDEEGTEAAAVTSSGAGATAAPEIVVLDRPFLLLLQENHSGTILFMGRITHPRWAG